MTKKQTGYIRVLIPQLAGEHRLTISGFAEAIGVTWPTAKKLFSGKVVPNGEQLLAICEYFNVQPGDVLKYEP